MTLFHNRRSYTLIVCVKYILGSGLHHSNSLGMAAWVNVEGSSFVLSVRRKRKQLVRVTTVAKTLELRPVWQHTVRITS